MAEKAGSSADRSKNIASISILEGKPGSAALRLESRFGPILLIWNLANQTLQRVRIVSENVPENDPGYNVLQFVTESEAPDSIRNAASFIHALLSGTSSTFVFPLEQIPLWQCPAFQREVLTAEHAIQPGAITTYARLAESTGHRGAGRAVGSALSHNPFPLLIPCHRTIRSDGSLGGYQGGLPMKRFLLEQEGIMFLENGKVDLESVSYEREKKLNRNASF